MQVKLCFPDSAEKTYFESFPPTQNKVVQGNADIFIDDLAVSLRCVIIPEDMHGANDLDARSVSRDDDYALLLVTALVAWITFSHDQVHFSPWVASPTDPPGHLVIVSASPEIL